jgi:hypothetical protein
MNNACRIYGMLKLEQVKRACRCDHSFDVILMHVGSGGTPTTRASRVECGVNFFCPANQDARQVVTTGYYSTGVSVTTRDAQYICELGYRCSNAERFLCVNSVPQRLLTILRIHRSFSFCLHPFERIFLCISFLCLLTFLFFVESCMQGRSFTQLNDQYQDQQGQTTCKNCIVCPPNYYQDTPCTTTKQGTW